MEVVCNHLEDNKAGGADAAPRPVELPAPRHAGGQLPLLPHCVAGAIGGRRVRGLGRRVRCLHEAGAYAQGKWLFPEVSCLFVCLSVRA